MAEPIRGRVSPYTFLGRFQPQQQQQQVENAETNIALRRNQFAIANVNNSLVRITEQINVLSASLQGISTQIKETSTLETLKEQQKARQEKVLAEQQIREGKESQIERKIQAALVTPIQKVGAKAQGTLFNLTRFFNILLGGFLLNRILDSVAKLSKDGKFSLKNLGDAIVKDLAVVGGIFLAINGGFALALNSVVRLAALITKIAVKGLILAPIRLAFNIAGQALKGLANRIRNLPRVPRTTGGGGAGAGTGGGRNTTGGGTNTGGGRGRGGGGTTRPRPPRGVKSGTFFGTFLFDFLLGQGTVGQSGSAAFGATLPLLLGMGGLPAIALGTAGAIFAPSIYDRLGGQQLEQMLPGLGLTFQDLISGTRPDRNITPEGDGTDVSVINAGGGEGGGGTQDVPAATSAANYLPQISSSNSTNFYLHYSRIQYNVVG
jgi:hypothetical protein